MRLTLLHLLVLAAACALTYCNTLHNAFHLDDTVRVWNNVEAQTFWPPWRHFVDPGTSATDPRLVQYRPLLPLSLSLNVALGGAGIVSYHVGNLLLHLFASVGVYLFVRELLSNWNKAQSSRHAPLLVALLFAVHPVGGIPVNYIASRDLSMMLGFLMLTFWRYARMRRLGFSTAGWATCLSLLLLAILAKKNAVVAPVLLLLLEWLPGGRTIRDRTVWYRAGAFAAVAAALLLFVRFGLGFSDWSNVVDDSSDPIQYLTVQAQHHTFHYLRNFVWPFPIRFAPDDAAVVPLQIVGGAILVSSWILAWTWRRKRPLLAFCILAYQVLLAPTSSFIPFHAEIVPYRPYASSVFFHLAIALVVLQRPKSGIAVLSGLVLYFATTSFLLNRTWRTGETLWQHSVDHGGTEFAHASLGSNLADGERAEAAFREALRIKPGYSRAQVGLAMLEIRSGRSELGLRRLRAGVDVQPESAPVRKYYAEGLAAAGRREEAARQAAISSDLQPGNLDYRCEAAEAAVRVGKFEDALRRLEPLLRTRPGFKGTRWYAGIALLNLDRLPEAIGMFEQFVKDNPKHDTAWVNLGTAYGMAGQTADAIAALEKSVRLNPALLQAHAMLARLHREAGNHAAADRHLELSRGK